MNWSRCGVVVGMLGLGLGGGCGGAGGTEGTVAVTRERVMAPLPGESRRVGGDLAASISGEDGDYRSGPCRIDTPLPMGYPQPTPPGAIDLKTYPSVRRAEVRGTGSADRGMNSAFWPLFNHIQKHDIAMTSPVEMEFGGGAAGAGAAPGAVSRSDGSGIGQGGEWSMAFLYRSADQNATGQEGEVVVRDAEPITVVSIGMKGDYGMKLVERGAEAVEAWLAANPEWEAAGGWRSLYYNGPSIDFWNKWAEVQMPVRVKE